MSADWVIIVAKVGLGSATHFAMDAGPGGQGLETYCGAEGRMMARGSERVYPSGSARVTCRRCIGVARTGWASERWPEHARFVD
jgi:hypothetical protein